MVLATTLLMAQEAGQPLSIIPTPPSDAPPPAETVAEPDLRHIPPTPGTTGSVEVNALGQITATDEPPDRLLEPENGGLGADLWSDSHPAAILRLLRQTPAAPRSPAMNSLFRRLALSRTDILPDTNHLIETLRLLYDSGQVNSVITLARATQTASRVTNPAVTLWIARAQLARGDTGDACALLPQLPDAPPHTLFTLKLTALCDAVDGNANDALLTLDLARENGLDDPLFTTLLLVVADDLDPPPPSDAIPGPFHTALLRAAGKTFPPQHVLAAHPALLFSLARDTRLPDAARLRAAERAITLHILSADTLAALYATVSFDGIQMADPQITAAALPDPLVNALYYQAILIAPDPAIRVRFLAAAFQAAAPDVAYAVARANAPALQTISPVAPLGWFAPQAIMHLTQIGEFRRAAAWAAVLPDAATAPATLLARLAQADITADTDNPAAANIPDDPVAAARIAAPPAVDETAVPRTLRQAAILSAIGLPPADRLWQDVALAPSATQPAPAGQISTLHAFARDRRAGLTVLLSLIALRRDGPQNAAPETLDAAITALRRIGLHHDARAIAVEALLREPATPQTLQ